MKTLYFGAAIVLLILLLITLVIVFKIKKVKKLREQVKELEKEIRKIKNIELGICFHANGIEPFKSKKEDVTYYPISSKNYFTQIIHRILYNRNKVDSINVRRYLEVINDFKPDIINIFGSENCFGLISLHTQINILYNLQL